MDLLNSSAFVLIAFGLTIVIILIISGLYVSRVEKKLQNIELLAQKIEILMTNVSDRVEKMEDKILILAERVGWLEGRRMAAEHTGIGISE